ncbi:DUF885 domain-containing protein [Actinokineospora bangkokensis]|uniref:DUF885 domain-containing protein n=1 Tax=Actinokineospora bangkokensis TaxID=1193682 RepID=A0A1Q9LT13_9PSEU|nr:DUF885 domain-containing protein [Actinokineospora bangkokensis]OLR95176.1 hypothetical protein BJP25_07720 [Actinokineospora bangkokensis]
MAPPTHDVHTISDDYVDAAAAADPVIATLSGIPGYDHLLPDYSPEGVAARAAINAGALERMAATEATDALSANAKAVFTERVGLAREIDEAGLTDWTINVVTAPALDLRSAFDLMPTGTAEDWDAIGARLAAVPAALAGHVETLRAAAARGQVAAVRQVTKVAEQCRVYAGQSGTPSYFTTLVAGAGEHSGDRLVASARAADQAYAELADFLEKDLAPIAPTKDAVGAERYALFSRLYTGAKLDLAEAYAWGWEEFTRVETEMREVAGRVKPGATIAEAAAHLDQDPRYQVTGQRALQEWMQRLSDQALADLRGVHFDIPDRLMALECRIAPPGGPVGAYYSGPSDDWSRPGRMWWSVPVDREGFSTWREVTTVYHEGVPGHHLQIATAVNQADSLNRFQRLLCWVPGHGEGWALYAERLMREFGYLSDDGDLMGMLDAHLFRAARVIVDIGMHLELEIPKGTGFHEGERWTPELGLEFLLTRTITDPAHVRDEIDRYLGWAGQAPAYKLGERLWLRARDEVKARQGADFDLKRFHRDVLEMGAMGLDTLSERLAAL